MIWRRVWCFCVFDAGTIYQESVARGEIQGCRPVSLSAEVGEEPEEKRKGDAQNEAGDDGEIKGGVFAAVDDVAGELAKAEGEFSSEIEEGAEEDEQTAEEQESAAQFAEGVHRQSVGHEI